MAFSSAVLSWLVLLLARLTMSPSSEKLRYSTLRAASSERRKAPVKPSSSTTRSRSPASVRASDGFDRALEQRQGKGWRLFLADALEPGNALHQNLELLIIRGRVNTSQGVGLSHGRAVALDGGHLFAGFGQVGDEARERVHRSRQRFQPVFGAPGAEPLPVAGVSLGRVRRPLQAGLDEAGRVLGEVGQRQPLRSRSRRHRHAFPVVY